MGRGGFELSSLRSLSAGFHLKCGAVRDYDPNDVN
jgi:hypothetical protein